MEPTLNNTPSPLTIGERIGKLEEAVEGTLKFLGDYETYNESNYKEIVDIATNLDTKILVTASKTEDLTKYTEDLVKRTEAEFKTMMKRFQVALLISFLAAGAAIGMAVGMWLIK